MSAERSVKFSHKATSFFHLLQCVLCPSWGETFNEAGVIDLANNSKINMTLSIQNCLNKNGMACKHHREYAHASSVKLIKLLKSAGKPWSYNNKLHNEIQKLSKICNICK